MPNLQDLERIDAGDDAPAMITLDMDSEEQGRNTALEGVRYCEEVRDYVSRELLTGILNETEAHIDWLTQQVRLIDGGRRGELQAGADVRVGGTFLYLDRLTRSILPHTIQMYGVSPCIGKKQGSCDDGSYDRAAIGCHARQSGDEAGS